MEFTWLTFDVACREEDRQAAERAIRRLWQRKGFKLRKCGPTDDLEVSYFVEYYTDGSCRLVRQREFDPELLHYYGGR